MRATVPLRPGRPLGVLLIAAALGSAAAPAHAEVVVSPIETGPRVAQVPGPTIVSPDGRRRVLPPIAVRPDDGWADTPLSPDHRWIARPSGARVLLIPTDGGSRRVLGAAGVRTGVRTTVWWDADASHVLSEGGYDRDDRDVLQRCALATGTCSTAPIGGRQFLGPLWSGASLWEHTASDLNVGGVAESLLGDWYATTPETVARIRRGVRRPVRTRLVGVGSDGHSSRVLWRRVGSLARGVDSYTVVGDPSPDGVLLEHVRRRDRVATRRAGGRLQVRLVSRRVLHRWLRVSDDGRIHPFAFRPTGGDRDPGATAVVPGPGGTRLVSLKAQHGTALIGIADPAGRIRRLSVGTAPLTTATLHRALGLPAGAAASPDVVSADFRPEGYEAATNSAIVAYDDQEYRTVIARVPLDGSAPSLVDRNAAESGVTVTAW